MSEAIATPVETAKPRQIATTVSADMYEKLDNHRWEARIEKFSDLMRDALDEYIVNHGL